MLITNSQYRVLCETVKGFVERMTIAGAEVDRQKGRGDSKLSSESGDRKPSMTGQCEVLSSKLEALLSALNSESSMDVSDQQNAEQLSGDQAQNSFFRGDRGDKITEPRTSAEGTSSSGEDEINPEKAAEDKTTGQLHTLVCIC